jgi:elongation factor Ts
MAEISASDVKELRARTGAGMMECKRALQDASGNMEEAVTLLRKAGAAKAEKKASRSTGEGRIAAYVDADRRVGALVEINCETDFVARTDDFKSFGAALAKHVATHAPRHVSAEDAAEAGGAGSLLLDQQLEGAGMTVGQALEEKIGRLGENMKVRRFARLAVEPGAHGAIASYVHAGDKIGVLVELAGGSDAIAKSDEVRDLGRDLAMHVAAASPRFVGRDEVTQDVIDREREIYRALALNEGKAEAVVDKVVEGRIVKYYAEACLLEQPFVKNPDVTVGKLAKEKGGKLGGGLEVKRFVRMAIGD